MKKLFSNLFLSCLLGLTLNFNAFAASTVQFENGAENFVFYSDSDWSETDLFGGLKNLIPGDTRSENILIKNSAPDFDYIKIYLRAEPVSAPSSAFLSKLTLNLYKDSELISRSSASEQGSLQTNLELGTVEYNDETLLTAEILAPASLTSEFSDTSAEILWTFTAEAFKNGVPVPITPNTGSSPATTHASISKIIIIVALASIIALTIIKKRDRNSLPSRF